MTIIRAMTPSDLAWVSCCERKNMINPWSKVTLKEVLSLEHYQPLVACLTNNKLIAYAIFSSLYEEANLLKIAVDKPYQQQGYASQLIQQGLFWAQKKQARYCLLEVAVTNISAISFYTKVGFKTIDIRKKYYKTANQRVDAKVMRLSF